MLVEGKELIVSQRGDLAGDNVEEGKEDDNWQETC